LDRDADGAHGASPQAMNESRTRRFQGAALLALALVAAYALLGRNHFVAFDDQEYILDNPHVLGGLAFENVKWAFTHAHAANWHPLTWISHMLDVELFGLDPRGHHAIGLALHAVNAWLLLALLARFGAATWAAWFAAALFALHPLRVESVAWASERKDVLSACFALLALHAWARWVERMTFARYLSAAAAFACALLAKPSVVTLPFVLLLLDVWPFARVHPTGRIRCWSLLVAEKLPLFALAAAASFAAVHTQDAGQALGASDDYPFAARIANALHAYGVYLAQTAWPTDLVAFYPFERRGFDDPSVIGGGLGLLVGSALAWRVRRSRPWLLVGWLWFVGALVPMIGLVQVGGQSHADRYTYLPHLGLAFAAAFAFDGVRESRRRVVGAALLGVGVCLGALTFIQVGVWKDSETLFRHALARTGPNYAMENGLADQLLATGRAEEALTILDGTVRVFPGYRKAQYNRMRALAELGRYDEATAVVDAWLRSFPGDAAFSAELVRALVRDGEVDAAEREARRLFAIEPRLVELRRELGLALLVAGRNERGYQELQFAATLAPDDGELAQAAAGAREIARSPGELGPASQPLRRELAARAEDLGDHLRARGRTDAARAAWSASIEFDPERRSAREKLADPNR
jgi:tetratricopeptide (TPR) repeat protein